MKPKLLTLLIAGLGIIGLSLLPAAGVRAETGLAKNLAGRILLAAEKNGRLYYVSPLNYERTAVSSPAGVIQLIRQQGLGISGAHLDLIPAAGEPVPAKIDRHLTQRLAGRILIAADRNGEAYYVNPLDHKRYFLGRPEEGYRLFSSIALGINNMNLDKIKESRSIVDIAVGAGSFKTLVAAVEAAGLAETLDNEGPFTVFAPTDEAFAKLPFGTVDNLLKDVPQLKSILLYHVVAGSYPAAKVAGMESIPTLEGRSLTIDATNGVMVGPAKVVNPDVFARNGVIHVIDTVLLPQ